MLARRGELALTVPLVGNARRLNWALSKSHSHGYEVYISLERRAGVICKLCGEDDEAHYCFNSEAGYDIMPPASGRYKKKKTTVYLHKIYLEMVNNYLDTIQDRFLQMFFCRTELLSFASDIQKKYITVVKQRYTGVCT